MTNDDELIGLAAALLAIGSVSLVAALLPVPDDASRVLMLRFHRNLKAGRGVVQIEEAAGRITLSGVVSGLSGEATIETTTTEPRNVQVDESGWFRVEDLPTGALRVHVTAADGRAVATSWIRT